MNTLAAERFAGRGEAYRRGRPRYPAALRDILRDEIGLTHDHKIADIGSGTGLSSEPFLALGNQVFAVEPNREMREIAERHFGQNPLFVNIEGSAEATTLRDSSIDLIAAGQAFHWFEKEKARTEFIRILKQEGRCILFWNVRVKKDDLAAEYETLLKRFSTDYKGTGGGEARKESNLIDFFGAGFQRAVLPNTQRLDLDGLISRIFSASYSPLPGDPRVAGIIDEAASLFERHQYEGKIIFEYQTEVNWGRLLKDEE